MLQKPSRGLVSYRIQLQNRKFVRKWRNPCQGIWLPLVIVIYPPFEGWVGNSQNTWEIQQVFQRPWGEDQMHMTRKLHRWGFERYRKMSWEFSLNIRPNSTAKIKRRSIFISGIDCVSTIMISIAHDYKILNDLRTQKGSLHIEWDFES